MDFCKCELIGDNAELMKISCNQNIAQPQPTNDNPPLQPVPQGKINQNGKREITYTDDIIYFYDDIEPDLPSLPPRKKRSVNVKMSLENATEYCTKSLLSTKAAQVCLELSNVNVSNAITQCAADLQVTDFSLFIYFLLNYLFARLNYNNHKSGKFLAWIVESFHMSK